MTNAVYRIAKNANGHFEIQRKWLTKISLFRKPIETWHPIGVHAKYDVAYKALKEMVNDQTVYFDVNGSLVAVD